MVSCEGDDKIDNGKTNQNIESKTLQLIDAYQKALECPIVGMHTDFFKKIKAIYDFNQNIDQNEYFDSQARLIHSLTDPKP